ncbi:hypothetical protein Tco_1308493 [Tanacetum coccineum]
MLTHATKGEGSGEPTEPQTTPSPIQPSTGNQTPETSPSYATTRDSRDSLEETNGNEGDQVQTLHDSPLSGGHASDRAEGALNLHELSVLCMVKECEKIIHEEEIWKAGVYHSMEYMETEEVKLTDDTEVVEDKGNGDKGGNAEELVSTVRPEVSTTRPDIDAARQEDSAVEPRTPPTTTSIFDDEDITMDQTFIKIKEEKAKEKGVSIKDVDDSSRPKRSILTLKPLPTIDPKDKGKGVLKESPIKKVKRSDLDEAQIAKDAEIARLSLYDDIQAKMDASEELAARLQMEERERCTQ